MNIKTYQAFAGSLYMIVTFRVGEFNLLGLIIKNRSTKFRELIETKSCVASFDSMLGLLVRKFGSESIINKFRYS
ncbi:hypothetical protein HF325_000693 [Metschnikowia pulcherrima]|uniref:Uncharacterized protein n=1 Tax=Metschnikowia pulcherrima TaxID=27326 RepID=A0A8H7GZ39_9ASCO|nr:hypothetical protein HF325_000693 [Metschnikowia pulcherrima]